MLKQIPSGLRELLATYGDPSDPHFEALNIVSFDFPYPLTYAGHPVTKGRCHRLVVDNMIQAFKNVQAVGFQKQFTEYNGIYNYRPIRGMHAHLSVHAFGAAIDMGASTHPLGSHNRFPEPIVKAFADCGFEYGGDFHHRPDGMHFQLCRNY